VSAKQLTWALTRKGLKPTERVVLMILADRSDKDGWSYYSQETIADKAEVTRKTARAALQALEAMGFIRRSHRSVGNLRTSDHIQISLGKNFSQSGKKLPTIPTTPYGVSKRDKGEEGYQDGATGEVIAFPYGGARGQHSTPAGKQTSNLAELHDVQSYLVVPLS
jgi:DNA-binding transcriptional MocR family regulator